MTAANELNRHALAEHRALERETLERVQAEALGLEQLPDGEEDRDPMIVDGCLVTFPRKRIGGTLKVRW